MRDDETAETYAAEVHQFASLVRARIDGARTGGEADSDSEQLWRQTYGRMQLQAGSLDELLRQVEVLLRHKLESAAVLVIHLADRLAELQQRDQIEVIDDAEREVTTQLRRM